MKLRKNAILSLLLALICLFAACDEASEGEITEKAPLLEDFVYETEIDTEHVISEAELAAMNYVWLSEFGKELAATPEEAMKRDEMGDFYFGRYGRTFVFYKKSFDMDMDFGWGKYDFVFPWGEFYFLTDEKVYSRTDIAATDIFTDEHIEAFYNCYKNTYLSYKPDIVLGEGEYILTEADLEWMHGMFERSPKFTGVDTLGNAMRRVKDSAYYFGKYGDTVIVWNLQNYSEKPNFTLCGYDFEFYNGAVLFFDPAGLYKSETEGVESIMTADEWKAFYDHYIEHYVPFNSDPYIALEFTSELAKLTEDEMKKINKAYEDWNYEKRYSYYYEMYIAAKQTPADAAKNADSAAFSIMGYDPHRFFNEKNFKNYQYFGKKGSKIFLATQNTYNTLTILEIAGYKFVLDGSKCDIFVYENGNITPLAEAYEKGTVTKSEVAFAHERHLAYAESLLSGKEEVPPPVRLKIGKPYKSGAVELTEEEVREIVWEYIADSHDLEGELESYYAVRCYGKFGDVYAVMIDGPWMYTEAMRMENIAGYRFTFSNGQRMHIYKNGDFYSLNKAYELAIIGERELTAIEWSKTAPFTYEKTSAPVKLDEQEIKEIINSQVEYGADHKKGTVYSIRCYGKTDLGCVAFLDCSDKTYQKTMTSDKVGAYEFIYPTTQRLSFFAYYYKDVSLNYAYESKLINDEQLKEIYETYRAAHRELYE